MKKFFSMICGFAFSLTIIAQGNKGAGNKGQDNQKNEQSANPKTAEQKTKEQDDKKAINEHSKKVWAGTNDKNGGGLKPSKNQPAKVSAAFQKDYPNAGNVTWNKYRGDWTASFQNGPFISTAVYHANGERRDTRTTVTRNEVPRNVLDSIFKRRPAIQLGDIIKIEVPNSVNNIFRIKNLIQGKTTYVYYNGNGELIKYNY
jgi:hypothetical protein